ncbi:MAG: hypothetical protein HW416_2795, partial [Chloroflexi bacterium]|nr:hypothetical protein [Chloroflexota bacterium]
MDAPQTVKGPKKLITAINGTGRTFSSKLDRAGSGSTPGSEEVEDLVNSGLVVTDARGAVQPLIAEAVPSLENGAWVLLPDGRMETTWRLRPGAVWQDGTPVTSVDLLFTVAVALDTEIKVFGDIAFDSFEGIRALDDRAVVVSWKRPYIEAHTLFTRNHASPLPKHLLERDFTESKASFLDLTYWTQGFIGTGPFRLREWVAGSHVVLEANNAYVLGRPKLDEVEVRFIPDGNALFANLLAGSAELTIGRGLSIEQAAQLQGQWADGAMHVGALGNWVAIYPQFINPIPPAMLNVQFRRAILHAMDRKQMADSLVLGYGAVADSIISPKDPEYPLIESRIVKYDYDLRRAAQMIEGLGYARGPDGIFRDDTNQPLVFQAQGTTGATQERTMLITVEFLRQLGLTVEPDFIPAQARSDRARRSERPGFEVQRQTNGVGNLYRFNSRETPLPENNFVGDNRSRYRNTELDASLDRFFGTVRRAEQMQALGDVVHHMTDQLNALGLIFDGDPILMANRVRGVEVPQTGRAAVTWNAQEWDVQI